MKAWLVGDKFHPSVELVADWGEWLPDGSRKASDWIKSLPSRSWDSGSKRWIADGFGGDPGQTLGKVGVHLDTSRFEGEPDFEQLLRPLVGAAGPGRLKIAPRLLGRQVVLDALGGAGTWNRQLQRVELRAADWVDLEGAQYTDAALKEIAAANAQRHVDTALDLAARNIALSGTLEEASDSLELLRSNLGGLEGFRVDLYDFQLIGAYAVAQGRWLLADEPGVGKTYTSLAAATIAGCRRLVAVVPPIVLTNWARSVERCGTLGQPVIVKPGRKEPALPTHGVVIVSDSLLAARRSLLERIIAWAPDALIYDEAHRAKGWTTSRANTVRELAEHTCGPRMALTGTPLMKSPAEIAAILGVTGQLEPHFGSWKRFLDRFCYLDQWQNPKPRKRELPALREILDAHIWVRRTKHAVLPGLPTKTWNVIDVDVPLKEYRAAHKDTIEQVQCWLRRFRAQHEGRYPSTGEIEYWAQENLGVLAPLRRAAGLAKVDAAAELVGELAAAQEGPLILWCHHRQVMDALSERLGAPVIDGSTSLSTRTRLVDQFQAGEVPVLIAQITAAGVGITLTASTHAIFVETDWTAALVEQAEDRIVRIGATAPKVTFTTLLAVDTIDAFIHRVRNQKKSTADIVVGTGVRDRDETLIHRDDEVTPTDLLIDMVRQAMRSRR